MPFSLITCYLTHNFLSLIISFCWYTFNSYFFSRILIIFSTKEPMENTEHQNPAANEHLAPLGVMFVSLKQWRLWWHWSILLHSPLPVAKEPWKSSWMAKVGGALLLGSPHGARVEWDSDEQLWREEWVIVTLWEGYVVFCYFAYQNELETHNSSKILMFSWVCVYNHAFGLRAPSEKFMYLLSVPGKSGFFFTSH